MLEFLNYNIWLINHKPKVNPYRLAQSVPSAGNTLSYHELTPTKKKIKKISRIDEFYEEKKKFLACFCLLKWWHGETLKKTSHRFKISMLEPKNKIKSINLEI